MTYNNQIEIVLFDNNRKQSEKSPDKTGTVEFPDGTKYEVALWNRVSKNGNPFMSGSLKLPRPQAPMQGQRNTTQRPQRGDQVEVNW